MKGMILACTLAFAFIAAFRPVHAQQPVKQEPRDGIALWVAASDIDVLGAYIANWLPVLEPADTAATRPSDARKDDGPSYLQAAATYLDLAGPWSITNGIVLRAGFNNGPERDAPIVPGAPAAITGNRFTQVHEMLGRHVFLIFTTSF